MSDKGSVAVIIAAFNASGTICKAIGSALAEAETGEVVVVDDASRDNTVEAALSADDGTNRLKVIRQSINGGPSIARNIGIANSQAPWITILDADDYILDGRLAAMLQVSDDNDIVADDLWQVQEGAAHVLENTLLDHSVTLNELMTFSNFVEGNVTSKHKQRGELGFVKPIIRRSFLERHRIQYQENMRLGEDYELYARALAFGARFLLVPPKGYVSVCRQNSLSGRHTSADLLHLREADKQLSELPNLSKADQEAIRKHYISVDCRLQWRLAIEAVKAKSPGRLVSIMRRPWPVRFYVLRQLLRQVYLRSVRILKADFRPGE